MYEIAPVVRQNPFRGIEALHVHRVFASFLKLQADLLTDGLNLPGVGSRADHKIIGKGGDLAHIEHDDVGGLLGFRGADGGEPERGFRLLIGLFRI